MIFSLWDYFGFVGVGSILLCLGAIAAIPIYFRKPNRSMAYLAAVGMSVLAVVMGNINSTKVSNYQMDRSEEEKAEAKKNLPEVPAEGYEYQKKGKAKRDESQAAGEGQKTKGDEIKVKKVVQDEYRKLKPFDYIQANRWDRWNLFFTRLVFLAALTALIWDYLFRFNDALEGALPLPIAGQWLDNMSPKRLSVCVDMEQSDTVPSMMRRAIRKGETFIYLGPKDPLEGEKLVRLKFWCLGEWREWKWRVWKWQLGFWRIKEWYWELPRVTLSSFQDPPADDYALESVWFNRFALVVTDEKRARQLLDSAVAFLRGRRETGARARRSVNIIWDCDTSLPGEQLKELVELCLETNNRLLVTGMQEELAEWGTLFEQRVPALA